MVRNGTHQPREVLTSAGAIEVTVPRVNDKRTEPATGERQRFSSAILPPWCRKTPKITEVLPLLYLHGLSSGDFVPALGQFLGSSAGLSPAVITRLTETWKAEQRTFAARDLSQVDYVYVWADGIHVNIRLEEHKLCLLVLIGVRADGRKELIALADGYRESAESWADLLRDAARRGIRAPVWVVRCRVAPCRRRPAPLRGARCGAPRAGLWPWRPRPARPRRPSRTVAADHRAPGGTRARRGRPLRRFRSSRSRPPAPGRWS